MVLVRWLSSIFCGRSAAISRCSLSSGMVLTSIIEYITGYLLEKLFATKWWDYSGRRFNIHGRVCLRNSLLFGVLSVVAVRVIDPVIRGGIYALPG